VSVGFAALFSVLLALSVIDLELYILPNKITYPSILASLVVLPLLSWTIGEDVTWGLGRAVAGGLGYAGFLAVVLIAWDLIMRRPGMGVGDVKLAALLGLWVGWVSPYLVLYALIAASLIGLVAGGVAFVIRRENREYPYGPWMALGALLVLLAQEPILDVIL
jgi:leader peptidase (prepilin peptidase)/N-methyltransferase